MAHAPGSLAPKLGSFHPLPVIGHPPAFYERHVKQAEAAGDVHARASHKVGQYVTEAIDPKLPWEQKLKCFRHALKHYSAAPDGADGTGATQATNMHTNGITPNPARYPARSSRSFLRGGEQCEKCSFFISPLQRV